MSNTWLKRKEKRKVTFGMGENETKIDYVLIGIDKTQNTEGSFKI